MNDTACQRLGYTREQLLRMHVWDIDPDFPPTRWPAYWEELKAKGSLTFETRHQRRDGSTFPVEVTVRYLRHEDQEYACAFARLCAIRKSQHAAERAKTKILQHAARNQHHVRPATLEAAEYVYVLVSLTPDMLDVRDVLDLYRARWQIELCFKRLKSLFRLGHVPKRNDISARAWIEGKLLTVLLIERLLTAAHFFSPWGFELPATEPLARIPRGT